MAIALFSVSAPKLWNDIPETIKCSVDLNAFKRNLKTYLFKRHFNEWLCLIIIFYFLPWLWSALELLDRALYKLSFIIYYYYYIIITLRRYNFSSQLFNIYLTQLFNNYQNFTVNRLLKGMSWWLKCKLVKRVWLCLDFSRKWQVKTCVMTKANFVI